MAPTTRMPQAGHLKNSDEKPAVVLEDPEQIPTLYKAIAANSTLGMVLFLGLFFVVSLSALLFWMLLQVTSMSSQEELSAVAVVSSLAPSFLYMAAGLATLVAFLALRAIHVLKRIRSASSKLEAALQSGKKDTASDLSRLPAVSYLYILGSGGHTGEMIDLIKLSFKPSKNAHRRYIISRGDTTSVVAKRSLEDLIRKKCPDGRAGTHDSILVTRVRDVGDPYYLLPITALRSGLDVLFALTSSPAPRAAQPSAGDFKYPHVIVTNGPGTGFIVGLVAFLLKVLWLAPQNRLKVIYIESWARTCNLGVTGKLFHKVPLAHLFAVQNDQLSQVVGRPNMGNISARYAALPIPQ